MSSRLSKTRSVHTYFIPRTVYFGWICMLWELFRFRWNHFLSKMAYFLFFARSSKIDSSWANKSILIQCQMNSIFCKIFLQFWKFSVQNWCQKFHQYSDFKWTGFLFLWGTVSFMVLVMASLCVNIKWVVTFVTFARSPLTRNSLTPGKNLLGLG